MYVSVCMCVCVCKRVHFIVLSLLSRRSAHTQNLQTVENKLKYVYLSIIHYAHCTLCVTQKLIYNILTLKPNGLFCAIETFNNSLFVHKIWLCVCVWAHSCTAMDKILDHRIIRTLLHHYAMVIEWLCFVQRTSPSWLLLLLSSSSSLLKFLYFESAFILLTGTTLNQLHFFSLYFGIPFFRISPSLSLFPTSLFRSRLLFKILIARSLYCNALFSLDKFRKIWGCSMNINFEINVDFVCLCAVLRAESLFNDEKGSRTEMYTAQPNGSPRISAIQ